MTTTAIPTTAPTAAPTPHGTDHRRPKVLSLGGGLDSWAMLLDAEARGELPDVAAFVDVGDADNRATKAAGCGYLEGST